MSTHKIGLNEAQIEALTAATPEEDILTRAGGGFEMSYVTGEYVKRTMLNVFGGAVRYQVLNHVVDKGSLDSSCFCRIPTLREPQERQSVISDTWGRVEEFGTSTIRTDFGQAWKTAFTDATKASSYSPWNRSSTFTTRHKKQRTKLTLQTSQHGLKPLKAAGRPSNPAPQAQSFGSGK